MNVLILVVSMKKSKYIFYSIMNLLKVYSKSLLSLVTQ